MKKIQFFVAVLYCSFSLSAQEFSLTENQPAVIYSLPKSEVCIQLEIEKNTRKPGIYYQYSERYLATNQIILEEKTSYRIKSVHLSTRPVADPKRTYVIQPAKKSALNQLSVNEKGILCGVNVPCKPVEIIQEKAINKFESETTAASLLPLGEEYLMAGSVAKLAEGAAKQIYRIRESRLSLLTGDMEHLPADGASLQTMLDGLNNSEKELTELFVGKEQTSVMQKNIVIHVDSAMNNVIAFRLSAHKGLVDIDDLSGTPYYINLKPEKVKTNASVEKEKKTEVQTINTVYPAKTFVELTDGLKSLCSLQTEMPQFGVVVPVSAEVFKAPQLKVYVDPTNGRLLCVEK